MKEESLDHSVLWYTPVIPALGRLRQEDLKFKVNLGYIVRNKNPNTLK
jgi:hypothetical protein